MTLKIETLNEKIDVYDITVPETQNFYANDILVHNCAEITLPSRASKQTSETYIIKENGEKEIIKKYREGEIALCNLASINLVEYYQHDEQERYNIIYNIINTMDNTIDVANYPVKEAAITNKDYRYLGIGVNNYANELAIRGIVIDTEEALYETHKIFDEISYNCIKASMELAKEKGRYPKFSESKWADGILPMDIANKKAKALVDYEVDNAKWNQLREDIKTFGIRNATLMAIAPTACQTKEGKILLANGNNISLKDMMEYDGIDVESLEKTNTKQWLDFTIPYLILDGNNKEKEVKRIWYNGYVEVKEIVFADGSSYKFTMNHKLKLYDGHFQYVQYIQIGDKIRTITGGYKEVKSIGETMFEHTYDIEVPDSHTYVLDNGCISHNTSGKAQNATESIEPIQQLFYREEGTFSVNTIVPNFRKNNRYYKPAFDCDMQMLIKLAAIRQIYLDQAQSINMYYANPDSALQLTKDHLLAFDLGIKTLYYMKSMKKNDEYVCESCT